MKKKIIIPLAFFLIVLFPFVIAEAGNDYGASGPVPQMFTIYMNDSTGNINMTDDFSLNPTNFSINPQPGQTYRVERMFVTVKDSGISRWDQYGALGPLTNGIEVFQKKNGKIIKLSGENNDVVKTNGDWLEHLYDCQISESQGGPSSIDYLTCRWTFSKSGSPLRLVGDDNDTLYVTLEDDFTGILDHHLLVQGFIEEKIITDNTKEVSTSMASIAIIFTLVFVIIVYLFLASRFTIQFFKEHAAIKTLLMMMGLWLLLVPIQTMVSFNTFLVGPLGVTNLLNTVLKVLIWVNVLITFYFFLWFLQQLVKKFNKGKGAGNISD